MAKSKKFLLTTLSVVLVAIIAVLGTIAYLTDTDSDVNVMTLGNVQIDQIEQQRKVQSDDNTSAENLETFDNFNPLYPAVYEGVYADWARDESGNQVYQKFPTGGSSAMWTDEAKNVIDKIVFVENTGKSEAYVRTWFAFEQGSLTEEEFEAVLGRNINNTHWDWAEMVYNVEIAEKNYAVTCATYIGGGQTGHVNGVLPADETTRPSLLQVMLYNSATNEDAEAIDSNKDGKYDILVFSQACQTEGFANATAALNEAFGTGHPWGDGSDIEWPLEPWIWDGESADTSWYNTTDKTFEIDTANELAGLSKLSANGNTFSGKTIKLNSDIDLGGNEWTPIKQFSGTFDGGDHEVSNFTLDGSNGRAGFIQNLGQYPATVKDLTLSDVTGYARSGQYFGILAANGHTSIVENVHIVDCKVTTTTNQAWVGGIYGYFNWTTATNCTVENLEIDATNGAEFLGGFSGNMDQDLEIKNVDIIGLKITVNATNGACQVGGFTGQTQTGHRTPFFTNCHVIGLDIVATGEVQLGGFVGDAGAHTHATNCTVEGKIDATGVTDNRSFIGGFMADSGWNNNESNRGGHVLTNCSADVDIITGGSTAGGFIGSTTAYHPNDGSNRNMPATFTNCTATGTVTVASGKTATIGGFAGEAERGTFKNCSTTSDTFIGKIWDGYTLNDDGNGTLTVTK